MHLIKRIIPLLICGLMLGCQADVYPVMEAGTDRFFDMPWPNDIRRTPSGSPDFKHFPAFQVSPLATQIGLTGSSTLTGFGLNSGVFFRMSGKLAPDQFGSPAETQQPNALALLVNIDPDSPQYLERVPLKMDFDPIKTLFKPDNLLTLLPYPGYSLAPDAEYAAILFNGITDKSGKPVQPATLLGELDKPYNGDLGLSEAEFQQLRTQKQKVQDYVAAHTAWQPDDIVAFSVYSTHNPTQQAEQLARAVQAIDDQTVAESVQYLEPIMPGYDTCGYNNMVTFVGELDMPVWQHGPKPYFISGGGLRFTETGEAIQNGTETVKFSISFGCNPAVGGKPVVLYSGGTAEDHYGSMYILEKTNYSAIGISVMPLHGNERLDPQAEFVGNFLRDLGLDIVNAETIAGVIFYNYLNPRSAIGNQLQSAAEQIFIKRVAQNIEAVFNNLNMDPDEYFVPEGSFNMRPDFAGIIGQSQGATNAPIALAMDPEFKLAQLNAVGSLSRTQLLHRGSVRDLVNVALVGGVASEYDEFHPLLSVMENFHDPANGLNYASQINTDHLLVTAGYGDACVAIETALPIGFALARHGKLQMTLSDQTYIEGPFTEYQTVLNQSLNSFPVTETNLPEGGLGLYVPHYGGHGLDGAWRVADEFVRYSLGQRDELNIPGPRWSQSGYCDRRYDEWEYAQP